MNKVITINLNGRAYQLEEAGYEALRKYLDEARAALREDPDKDEIMADFEQAVADKCDACLKGSKNVVSEKEIAAIISKMGPVEAKNGKGAVAGEKESADPAKRGATPKRLYRIMEGSVLRGVCNGIAAYFNLDATLVRVIFALLTIFTGGGWAIAYAVLMFVMPVARTADEVAQAHGEPPFTAQDFIDRANAEYEKYKANPAESKQEWKQKMHAWKYEWRHEWREKRRTARDEWRQERQAEREARRAGRGCHGGFGAVVGVVITFILFLVFLRELWSLAFHGVVFGHLMGIGHPLWVSIVFLFVAFWLISLPFRHLMHDAGHCDHDHHCHHHHESGFFTLLFLVLFLYIAVLLFPPVRDAWNTLVTYLQSIRT